MMAYFSLPSNGESNKCPDLKFLLEGDVADINNILKCCKSTRLHHLLSMGLREETLQLLNKGADVNLKDGNGQTALHVAVAKKSVSSFIVKIIAENTSDVNITDIGGIAALHLAVSRANSAAVKVILQTGGNVDIQDYDGNSPLHYAFIYCLDLVETLIEHGANVELKNKLGETPIFKAIGAKEFVDIKLIEAMELILKKGANINVQSYNGDTPLHVAGRCNVGIFKLCYFLLNNGAKANIQDIHGMTPLHLAVMYNAEYFIEILATESGRSAVNIPTNQGDYPLHLASERRNRLAVKLLLDNGAVVDIKNKDNATALHLVTENIETGESSPSLLINNVQDFNIMTPLRNALENLNVEIVKLLLENRADVNSKNKNGETPLHIVTRKKSQTSPGYTIDSLHIICTTLLAYGATANVQDVNGMTPLHNAVKYKNDTIVQLLLENGAEVNSKNKKGETSLRYVQSVNALELLLKKGVRVNEQDNFGRTALHNIAKDFKKRVRKGKTRNQFHLEGLDASKLVLKLLEWGASPQIKDNLGKIPSNYYLFADVQKKYAVKRNCLYSSYNTTRNDQDSYEYQTLEIFKNCCYEEIERMKLELFGNNCLYDIFRHSSDPTFLSNKELESAVQSKDLKVKFPLYFSLLISTYHRSRERVELFDPVVNILTAHCLLPFEVMRHILTFVDNDSLRNVIKANEDFPVDDGSDSSSKLETTSESDTESDWEPEFSWNYDSEDGGF